MNSSLKNIKPYTLIELAESKDETHIIISGEHYEFNNVQFYMDTNLAIDRSEALELKGTKTLLLNTHALMSHFLSHEVECLGAELGIDAVNYAVKQ